MAKHHKDEFFEKYKDFRKAKTEVDAFIDVHNKAAKAELLRREDIARIKFLKAAYNFAEIELKDG